MQDAGTIDGRAETFGAGVLQALIAAMRRSRPGDLIRVTGTNPDLGGDLDRWCRFTRNTVVSVTETDGRTTWTIRCGELPPGFTVERPIGAHGCGCIPISTATFTTHRGGGTWLRAWRGVQTARAEGFRVRIAATVSSDEGAAAFDLFSMSTTWHRKTG